MGSFYRTEALKTSHYFSNGEGRDGYILVNNGGVERNTYPFVFKEESRTMRRKFLGGAPNLGAKSLKYKSNGTGRDTYIAYNHGGLGSSYQKPSFYTSLRTPSPGYQISMYKTQKHWQYASQKKAAKKQQEDCLRLSLPKFNQGRKF